MQAKKCVFSFLCAACLLLLSANTALCQAGLVSDAPAYALAVGSRQPAYLTQLEKAQERLVRQTPAHALQHTVMPGESLTAIAKKYGVAVAALVAANNLQNPDLIFPGQILDIPVAGAAEGTAPSTDSRVIASRSGDRRESLSTPAFIWPVSGRITSGFGPRWGGFHYGLDLAAPAGSPVKAIFAGTVTVAGWVGSYGYMVCIDHHNGWESVYGHNARLYVTVGQEVQKGQIIAVVGRTGNATGPHVHLETIYLGRHKNPLAVLPARRE